jgi:hypothetical protein
MPRGVNKILDTCIYNMTPIQKRLLLFLCVCIPTRLLLAATAKYLPVYYLPYMGIVTLGISLGFLYLYFTGTRRVGIETQGAPIWWMKFRILHGLLYLLVSLMAFMRMKNAYVVILLDTFVGLALFLRHHYNAGDF